LIGDGRWHPAFVNGALELVAGRHIETGDSGKAVISEELAANNGLAVGDVIESRNFDYLTGELYGSTFRSEIVGVFEVNFEQDLSDWTAESNIYVNVIFADVEMRHWSQVAYNTREGREVIARDADRVVAGLTLFVDDPLLLDAVIEQVEAVDGVDWGYYGFTRYDDDYKLAAAPLRTMVTVSTVLVVGVVGGALAALALVQTMWLRSRKRELGILSAIGVRKTGMLGQFVAETGAVAAVAGLLAALLAGPLTRFAGDLLARTVAPVPEAAPYRVSIDSQQRLSVNRTPSMEVALDYELSATFLGVALLVLLLVSIISVLIASSRLLAGTPRDLLRGG
jgi:ABC-type antimicrobial peptide transport system permease subunit